MTTLSNDLFQTFNKVIHHYRHYYGMQFSSHHKSVSQIRILKLLHQQNGQMQSTLAQTLAIRPSSLTECLNKLAAKDYIQRQSDEHDKRVTHVLSPLPVARLSKKPLMAATSLRKPYLAAFQVKNKQRLISCLPN